MALRTSFRIAGFAVTLAVAPLAVRAETEVQVPEGCEGFLTVQMKGCGVSHYWRCEGDAEGNLWEVHYDADGPFSISVYDREFQWLDSRYFSDGSREFLLEPGPDPASLTALLEDGEDTYAFVIRETGPDGERDIVHQGMDRLTGRTVTIDGQALLETEFSSVALDAVTGEEVYSVAGTQYVLAEERLFLLGPDTSFQEGEEMENDLSPVEFIRPGEAGFAATTPRFDCANAEEIGFRPDAVAPVPHATAPAVSGASQDTFDRLLPPQGRKLSQPRRVRE